jgi:Tryptophan-associated transmembrane protein (Trp_oprn_chp)
MAGPLLLPQGPAEWQGVRMSDGARRSLFPGLLAFAGGAAIVAGSSLTWLKVGGGVSVQTVSVTGTPEGTELLAGQVALGAGVAVVVLGLLLLVLRRARRLLGFLVIVGGLAAIAAGALVASSPEDRYIDFAVEKGAPAGQADTVRASLANLFVVSGQEADLGIGLYLAIGGGALAVIGGLTAVFGRRKPKPVEEAKEPSEPKPEGLPEEWLAARALEAEARAAPAQEPPPQELVTQAVPPPLPDPPPEPEEAAPWRTPLPEAPESPPEAEPLARAEEIEAPSDAAEESAPAPEEPAPAPAPVTQTVAPPEPAEEPAKPDDRAAWSKPLPDDWVAKPAKRRRRRP